MLARSSLAGAALLLALLVAPSPALASGITWQPPSSPLEALNTGGYAGVDALACAPSGLCVAGGYYEDAANVTQAFVMLESAGSWSAPLTLATSLNVTGAQVLSAACASSGLCVVGGYYADASYNDHAFVSVYANATWSTSEVVPSALASDSRVNAVACAGAQQCVAGGSYQNAAHQSQAFVIDLTGSTWSAPLALEDASGTPLGSLASASAATSGAQVDALACAPSGLCVAGGSYPDAQGLQQAFVADETQGAWGDARELADSLNVGGVASVNALACSGTSQCVAGGLYVDAQGLQQAFVADQSSGTWAGSATLAESLNVGGDAQVDALACAPSGDCVAGGLYTDDASHEQAFVAELSGGTWAAPTTLAKSLNVNGVAGVDALVCPSSTQCVAGGSYEDASGLDQAFVAEQSGASWAAPTTLAKSLNAGGSARVGALACSSSTQCVAGGYYLDASLSQRAFLVSTPTPLGTLGRVRISRVGTSAHLHWSAVAGASHYSCRVVTGTRARRAKSVTVTRASCTLRALREGSRLLVRVTAFAPGGASTSRSVHASAERTLVCVRGATHRRVTSVHPKCPAGFARSGS